MKTFLYLLFLVPALVFATAAPEAPVPASETAITLPAAKVSFTLRNNSLKSIPLLIPGVMNPNLSPASNSGVTLRVGQKILYRYKGKKRVLLVVSDDLEGQVLDVAKLLKASKKEVDAKK